MIDAGIVRSLVSTVVVWTVVGTVARGQTLPPRDDETNRPDDSQTASIDTLEAFPIEVSAVTAIIDRPLLVMRPSRLRLERSLRGFGQLGSVRFAASESFRAVTGSSQGLLWGGGVQFALANGLFFQGSYERFHTVGERVLVFENQAFGLGVEDTVTVAPVQVTAGYRRALNRRVVAYVGGGPGWYRFTETSEFAVQGEDVQETVLGYHVLGGLEYPVGSLVWLGGEAQWAAATGGLGAGGVSDVFDETDLGGFTVRFKLSVGR